MKKVLIVTYYYPPSSEMGVFRTLKFTRHLPSLGFIPYVLTVKNRSFGSSDHTLVHEIPSEARVIETFSAEHRIMRAPRLLGIDPRWFMIPDGHLGWLPFAVRRGLDIIRREAIDVILISVPVFSGALIGYCLKKKARIPLVIDFRDQWTESVFTTYPSALHRRVERYMERTVVESADFVITTTEAIRAALISKYPTVAARSETIPNGIDFEDFQGLDRPPRSDRFTITYAGRLYGPRTAAPFLRALRAVIDRDQSLREKIRVVFAGPRNKRTETLVKEIGLEDIVALPGLVTHRESLRLMVNSDVLLLLMAAEETVDSDTGTMMIPGKTFEYLGARRPILAVVPEGAAARMIRESGAGVVVPPSDEGAIEDGIVKLFRAWSSETLSAPSVNLSGFSREALTARLGSILESLPGRTHPDGPALEQQGSHAS